MKFKMSDTESKPIKTRLEQRSDANVRMETRNELRKPVVEGYKDPFPLDKPNKQTEFEKELRAKYTSFYNSNPKEVLRSSSQNVNKLQNNFLKTGNGFYSTKNDQNNNSKDEYNNSRTGKGGDKEIRKYDKPWLMNSTNRDLANTQTVKIKLTKGWRKPSATKKEAESRDQKRRTGQADTPAAENDFIDFDNYKREVNNMINVKENSMSVKNNLESRETAENKSEETQKTNRRLLNYEVGQRLGKGSYATVHEAVDVNTGKKCAIKTYEKAKMNNKTRKTIIEREIQVLNAVDHPKMIRLHKVIQTKNHIHIVMDLADGQVLSQYYKAQGDRRIREAEASAIFKQITEGIGYLHRLGIYHRDIKTENVLIDKQKKIRLIDFGFSVKSTPSTKLTLFCGTPNYMSPEIILKREYLGAPSDVWALGVLLFVITCGYFPFKGKDDKELHKKIVSISLSFPVHVSESLKGLINGMLKFNPEARLTCEQILEHPWFREAK